MSGRREFLKKLGALTAVPLVLGREGVAGAAEAPLAEVSGAGYARAGVDPGKAGGTVFGRVKEDGSLDLAGLANLDRTFEFEVEAGALICEFSAEPPRVPHYFSPTSRACSVTSSILSSKLLTCRPRRQDRSSADRRAGGAVRRLR